MNTHVKFFVLISALPSISFYQAALFCASSSASNKKLTASGKQKNADKEKEAAKKANEDALERLYKAAFDIAENTAIPEQKEAILEQAKADYLQLQKLYPHSHNDLSDIYDIITGTIHAPFIQQIVLKRAAGNHPFLKKSTSPAPSKNSTAPVSPSPTSTSSNSAAAAAASATAPK